MHRDGEYPGLGGTVSGSREVLMKACLEIRPVHWGNLAGDLWHIKTFASLEDVFKTGHCVTTVICNGVWPSCSVTYTTVRYIASL